MFPTPRSTLGCEQLEDREVPATILAVNTAGRLLSFDSNNPTVITGRATITGLSAAGEIITDIDVRPGNGLLYGRSNLDRLYLINPLTGGATPVGGVVNTTAAQVGMDFDPTADNLRVVSNTGENLAINPNTGGLATIGLPLSYVAGDVAQGQPPRVTALAFTNSLPLALTTTLYGLDHARDTLVRFTGSPQTGQITTVGSLGRDIAALAGFDIQAGSNVGFAAARRPGALTSVFYLVNLQTGAATRVGRIGNSQLISDIAIASGSSFLVGSVFIPPTTSTVPTSPFAAGMTQPLSTGLTQPLAPGLVSPLFGTTFSTGSMFIFSQPTSSTFNSFTSFSSF
jgi:hypothetical protein